MDTEDTLRAADAIAAALRAIRRKMLNAAILEAVRDWKRSEDWLADWMERRDAWRAAAWREAERAERQRQAAERKPEPDGERRPPRRIGIDRTKEAMGRAFQILAAPAKSKPH